MSFKDILDRAAKEPGITELFGQTDICQICNDNEVGYEMEGTRLCADCLSVLRRKD